MEQKNTLDPGKVAFLGVWRIIQNSHENQIVPVNIRVYPRQSVVGILHRLLDHFVASCHCRMIFPRRFGTGNPMILESRIGMVVKEEFKMPPIAANRPLRDAKKFQYITVFKPENLYSGIFGRFSFFHEMGRSMRLNSLENKHGTYFHIIHCYVLPSNQE
ncbi:MAG: hypothetical protein ABW080_17890 [Candidatus Thiodiazotropha sp.]